MIDWAFYLTEVASTFQQSHMVVVQPDDFRRLPHKSTSKVPSFMFSMHPTTYVEKDTGMRLQYQIESYKQVVISKQRTFCMKRWYNCYLLLYLQWHRGIVAEENNFQGLVIPYFFLFLGALSVPNSVQYINAKKMKGTGYRRLPPSWMALFSLTNHNINITRLHL